MVVRFCIIASWFFYLTSCQSDSSVDGGSQKEFITDSYPETLDSIASVNIILSDSAQLILEKYFSEELITDTKIYLREFNSVPSDTAFEILYNSGISLFEKFTDAFENPQTDYLKNLSAEDYWDVFPVYEELIKLNGSLGPIYFTCVAECSMLDFCFDLRLMLEKSKTTRGNADDDMMDILFFVEGDFGYAGYLDFKVWMLQYWDYGGANLLGDGKILDVIKRLQKFQATHSLFTNQIELVRQDVLKDLCHGRSYEFSVEEVLAEYNKIFKLNYFDKSDLKLILEQYNKLKSTPEDFQFNCEKGDCKFG